MAAPKIYSGKNKNGEPISAPINDPENITIAECLALACAGKDEWNTWRREYPVRVTGKTSANRADFSGQTFSGQLVDFSEFEFGDDASFIGAQFFDFAPFSNAKFGSSASFDKAQFNSSALFAGAEFGEGAKFDNVYFNDWVSFSDARFGNKASLRNVTFLRMPSFDKVQFGTNANFEASQFNETAFFYDAHFGDSLSFEGAQFGYGVLFAGARFGDEINFHGTQFGIMAVFDGAQFGRHVRFLAKEWSELTTLYEGAWDARKQWADARGLSPSVFNNSSFTAVRFEGLAKFSGRKFLGPTSFGRAEKETQERQPDNDDGAPTHIDNPGQPSMGTSMGKAVFFGKAPVFHDCTINQDTDFDGAIFPEPTGDMYAARAYRTLKLAFAQQQATREEQRFFRLEMAEEALYFEKTKEPRRWLFMLYRLLSDYGFSVRRPLLLFGAATFSAWLLYAWQAGLTLCNPSASTCNQFAPLVQFTLANALPGFEKLAEPVTKTLFGDASYGLWTIVTLFAQKTFSLLALFLIGLALRNLFKMK